MNAGLCLLEDWDEALEFLRSLGLSRAHLKRHIPSPKLKKPLRARQEVEFSLNVLNQNEIAPSFSGPLPKIISETEDFIILHKPANLHGHPLNYLENDNVLSWMRSCNLGRCLDVASDQHERGLLYRLDHATSGVLIYVKDQARWKYLRENFNTLAHTKRYLAVVDKMPNALGELSAWFDLTGKKVVARLNHQAGTIEGSLKLRVIREDQAGIALCIELTHGHRHQIRAHLAALGASIRGDELYGGKKSDRLYLHACQYELKDIISAEDFDLGFGSDFLDLHRNL